MTDESARLTEMPGAARSSPRKSILGIDYGRSRIGLAIADGESALARPLDTLERVNRNEDMRRLREIAREYGVRQIVIGLPLRLDGTLGDMAEEVRRFATRVSKQVGLPVELVDERLTTWEAERLLEEQAGRTLRESGAGHKRHQRKATRATVDAIAAAVILKEYLDRQHATKHAPENI